MRRDEDLADTEVFLELVTKQTERVLRKYKRRAVSGFLLLLIGIGIAIGLQQRSSYEARGVVCQILTDADKTTYAYEKEGTITKRQLRRALRASAAYRRRLLPAPHCSDDVTPPPPPGAQVLPRTNGSKLTR